MDGVTRNLQDEAMPYGVDTIRLRITFPAAPASRGYNGRAWGMRPLRGWTGGQADEGSAIPIADRIPAASNGEGGTQPALGAGADNGTMPNTAPPPLDPNRPFVVDGRYDDALRRVRETPPHYGRADVPVPSMPEGSYQPGLAFLMLRIAGARPEDLPQLYADIRALYMQPGAHRTGEALIRAAGDAAEAGNDLRARREILGGIAPVAKSNPLQLAADEFGQPGAVLSGGGAGAGIKALEGGESSLTRRGLDGAKEADRMAGTTYQEIVSQIPGKVLSQSSAIDVGALNNELAGTFSGGRYATMVTEQPLTLYRAWTPGQSSEFGAFWSLERPVGSLQTRIDSALLPEWGQVRGTPFNAQASQYTAIQIPAGTRLYVGEVGSQGGAWVGGKSQVLIEGGPQVAWKIGEGKLQ